MKWFETWAYENPKQAAVVLCFGAVVWGILIWTLVADGCRTH